MELICYTVMGVFPALVILSMVSVPPFSPCAFNTILKVKPISLLPLLSRSSRGCTSCCWVERSTVWAWSSSRATASFPSLTPSGTCSSPRERRYTTTLSGSTCTLSRPARSTRPDDTSRSKLTRDERREACSDSGAVADADRGKLQVDRVRLKLVLIYSQSHTLPRLPPAKQPNQQKQTIQSQVNDTHTPPPEPSPGNSL